MIERAFCDLESSKILKEIGYDEWATHVWKKNTRFSDEILEKHPGLSYCRYMELEKKYGGPHTKEELYQTYIEPVECTNKNSNVNELFNPNVGICSAPYCTDVASWLIEHKHIHITSRPYYCEDGLRWMFEIREIEKDKISLLKTKTGYMSSEVALCHGIKYYLIAILNNVGYSNAH